MLCMMCCRKDRPLVAENETIDGAVNSLLLAHVSLHLQEQKKGE
jgi:hypothetical protein